MQHAILPPTSIPPPYGRADPIDRRRVRDAQFPCETGIGIPEWIGGGWMDSGPGWLPDPEDEDQERYWSGSAWTDRVRPAGKGRSLHLPEHVPELQRALAAATADIETVEERLSNLFDRTEGRPAPSAASPDPAPVRDAGAPIAADDD